MTQTTPSRHAQFRVSPEEREASMRAYYKQLGLDKFMSIKNTDEKVKEQLEAHAGIPMYYPVGYDMKGRQYMSGYPLNPQGSKETRPLFKVVTKAASAERSLGDIEAEGAEVFGEDLWNEIKVDAEELVGDYMNPRTIAACSKDGKPSIEMFALLKAYTQITGI